MYISKISIQGFRNFKNTEIYFNDGINVLIGANNVGKSNLLKALSLVINNQSSKKLELYDFYQSTNIDDLKKEPPKITISLFISQSECEDFHSDDLVTVGNYLIKLEEPYEAKLTYQFFLPEKEKEKYLSALSLTDDIKEAWKILERDFLRFYTAKIWGGEPNLQIQVDSESLQKFDFQFLDAIRDVERDMFSGRNTLLKDIFHFFIDYDIKSDVSKNDDEKLKSLKDRTNKFSVSSNDLISQLQKRIEKGKGPILEYAKETGASFNNAEPNFAGELSDIELFSALKLIIEYKTGITIPTTHNGLGYNNLIFMSLLLAKMQVNSDGSYLGSNAKVFPVLAIEEPEAHLHPSMQYKFLKFLKDNKNTRNKVRQIFVTTHSTQIVSAVSLNEIICLHSHNNCLSVGYPGKVFTESEEDKKSKAYVQRFLDATKSDMLFAQKVILVEGITEELLLPTMAKYLNYSLEDEHIIVINIGGRYFNHFIKLFNSLNNNTIFKKIACITDRDHTRKAKEPESKFEKCYPYEFFVDPDNYEYKDNSKDIIDLFETHPNIRFFSQELGKSSTFEYDLLLHNPNLELLITESTQNKQEIKEIMNDEFDIALTKLRTSKENIRICDSLISSCWKEDEKKKALVASRYLNSVSKGSNALELCSNLEDNLMLLKEHKKKFNVPVYIKEAIKWIMK